MTKNIAQKALEIAKKREIRKRKNNEALFLEMVQERFNKNLEELIEWTAIANQGYYRLENNLQISKKDLHDIAQKLGFFIAVQSEGKFFELAIHEYEEETELTPAQTMLKDFRSKFARKVGEQVEMAIKLANDILEDINKGNFEYKKNKNTWSFKVKVLPPCEEEDMSIYFSDKMHDTIQRAGFNGYRFVNNATTIILYYIEDEKKEN